MDQPTIAFKLEGINGMLATFRVFAERLEGVDALALAQSPDNRALVHAARAKLDEIYTAANQLSGPLRDAQGRLWFDA